MRNIKPKRKAIRPRSEQPDLPDDLKDLIKKWHKSAAKRKFQERFQYRGK